jgi:hypothetical protein
LALADGRAFLLGRGFRLDPTVLIAACADFYCVTALNLQSISHPHDSTTY